MNSSCNVHHIDGGVITWGISIFTESVRNSGLIVGTHLNCLKQRSNNIKISKSTLYKCKCYKSTPLLCCSGAGGLYLFPVVHGLYGGVIYVLLRLGITLTALLTLRCKKKKSKLVLQFTVLHYIEMQADYHTCNNLKIPTKLWFLKQERKIDYF